ncbi:hypothetical protein DPMN_171655 [Dreissena polymorpha]|uniref:Uncharacterized protein n=1 Tax=Dreissena polymorpha TaxID=45954 RepID=A0A9D4E1J6_DREPO|nr:hypothetical protein DPMN_171655 [Dreissena polymorpha]
MRNLLMLHDEITHPQQYQLKVIRGNTPEPENSVVDDVCVMKDSVDVLYIAKRFKQYIEHRNTDQGEATKMGPL